MFYREKKSNWKCLSTYYYLPALELGPGVQQHLWAWKVPSIPARFAGNAANILAPGRLAGVRVYRRIDLDSVGGPRMSVRVVASRTRAGRLKIALQRSTGTPLLTQEMQAKISASLGTRSSVHPSRQELRCGLIEGCCSHLVGYHDPILAECEGISSLHAPAERHGHRPAIRFTSAAKSRAQCAPMRTLPTAMKKNKRRRPCNQSRRLDTERH